MFDELIPSSGSMEMYIESEGEREKEKEREREVERRRERESFFVYLNSEQLELFHTIELISLN